MGCDVGVGVDLDGDWDANGNSDSLPDVNGHVAGYGAKNGFLDKDGLNHGSVHDFDGFSLNDNRSVDVHGFGHKNGLHDVAGHVDWPIDGDVLFGDSDDGLFDHDWPDAGDGLVDNMEVVDVPDV